MKKNRILASILASAMLLPLFASCAAESEDTETQGSVTTSFETEGLVQLKDNLPVDLNYGGDTIVFINDDSGLNLPDEIYVEEINSDPVNDAIYERNKAASLL